ncbi:MAG: hypothetical protein IJO71_01955 [Microbacterium sp.]|uniref:hypothetical protein n=1 Tax=Microbacterium sp. TaxID=51671 RepID=UPI0025D4BDEA|nr:hypothetical protein [Microbacterium sp.]MBQ9915945.1 hypothetical protein [Microbacterium sp.]
MAQNWPISGAVLGAALGFKQQQIIDEAGELQFFADTACSIIDRHTGRHVEQARHELPNGSLPPEFTMSAREQGKHMWNQTKSGGGARGGEQASSAPAGVGLLAKVAVWLEPYPPRPGFGGGS